MTCAFVLSRICGVCGAERDEFMKGVPTRVRNALWRAGYHSWATALGATDKEILSLRHLGRGSLEIIRQLRLDNPEWKRLIRDLESEPWR